LPVSIDCHYDLAAHRTPGARFGTDAEWVGARLFTGCWDRPWAGLYWGWWWPVHGCRVGWKSDPVGYPEGL